MEIEITGRNGAIRAGRLVELAEDLGLDRVSVVVKEGWEGDRDRSFILTWGRERKSVSIPVGSPESKAIHIMQQALIPAPKAATPPAPIETTIIPTEAPKKRGRKPKNEDQSV